jgi:hypothetical protein
MVSVPAPPAIVSSVVNASSTKIIVSAPALPVTELLPVPVVIVSPAEPPVEVTVPVPV